MKQDQPLFLSDHAMQRGFRAKLGIISLWLALACAAAAVFSGIGYRLDLWDFRTGFAILRWTAVGGIVAAAVALAGILFGGWQRAWLAAILGLIIGAATAYVPWHYKRIADSLPYIHDITTDTANPPTFVAVLPLRKDAPNSVEYAGAELAAQQRSAYPDLAPLILAAPKDQVFQQAEVVVRSMGMETVDASLADGRLEATATSLLYGFKDDMVVRLTPAENGTRVDVRSVSRVGRSDVGMNAKRIRTFLAELRSSLAQ